MFSRGDRCFAGTQVAFLQRFRVGLFGMPVKTPRLLCAMCWPPREIGFFSRTATAASVTINIVPCRISLKWDHGVSQELQVTLAGRLRPANSMSRSLLGAPPGSRRIKNSSA